MHLATVREALAFSRVLPEPQAMRFLPVGLILFATPALAQFPPPGIYACATADGVPVGELTLLVAGDYDFQDGDGVTGKGQVASAGTDVTPLSGPLHQRGYTGAFETDDTGKTRFRFDGPEGLVVFCE